MTRVAGAAVDNIAGRIVLDWKAYFKKFVEKYGEPVFIDSGDEHLEGFLLFEDGRRYAVDYQGPEFEPPTNAKMLLELKKTYWRLRIGKLLDEREKLLRQVKWLENRQELTSIPLQQRVYYRDETESGQVVIKATPTEDLNLDGIKHKILDLEHLLQECRTKQKEVE